VLQEPSLKEAPEYSTSVPLHIYMNTGV